MRYSLIIFLCIGLFSCHRRQDQHNRASTDLKSDSIDRDISDLIEIQQMESVESKKKNEKRKPGLRLDLAKIDSFECNTQIILYVSENMDSLTTNDIDALLRTFDESCTNNVEFLEFSNEVLCETLDHYPLQTLSLLEASDSYHFKSIFQELRSPLHDLLPIQIDKIQKLIYLKKLKGDRIDSVLAALKIALDSQ